MFSQKDLQQINDKGISIDDLNRQIKYFKSGFPFADIVMPATPSQGIMILTEGEEKHFSEIFDKNRGEFKITRFIPASGAATRMFKALFEAWEALKSKSAEEQSDFISKDDELQSFFYELKEYPFYDDLKLTGNELPDEIIERLLGEIGLNYGSQPKGLLKFHKYKDHSRTAFEEHLREAVEAIRSGRYEAPLRELMSADDGELRRLYKEREMEPWEAGEDWKPKETRYL